jgi:predicted Zn-dependent protease
MIQNKQLNILRTAMRQEIARSMGGLKAKGHPKPYYISYLMRDIDSLFISACYGSICQDREERRRNCYADVRVGNYSFDQTTQGGLSDSGEESESTELSDMPLEGGEDAIRFCLWRLTDSRYREAVRDYHMRKSRDISFLDQNRRLPSFIPQKPAKSETRLTRFNIDMDGMRDYLRKASLLFKDYPEIKNSSVEFAASLKTKIFISSEGVERVWQQPLFSLTGIMWMHTKRSDLDESLAINVGDFSELPSLAEFKKILKARINDLYKVEAGESIASYSGPVLLAPKPAGLFIHEVLGHRLEGSRLLADDEGKTFKDKVGCRIMHEGLTIVDDPTMENFGGATLFGHYPFDDEGTAAHRVTLIEKGVLRQFLTTRSPIDKKMTASNGHARNQGCERPISRMGNLIVEASGGFSFAELKKKMIEEIKRSKLPYGIILYDVEGGETGTEAYNFQAFLGQITKAAKIFPSGKEVFVKGVDFVGTPLVSLSHIIAFGNEPELDNGFCGAESGTIPVSTISPALLLSSLELQAKDSSVITQHALPLPWHDKK